MGKKTQKKKFRPFDAGSSETPTTPGERKPVQPEASSTYHVEVPAKNTPEKRATSLDESADTSADGLNESNEVKFGNEEKWEDARHGARRKTAAATEPSGKEQQQSMAWGSKPWANKSRDYKSGLRGAESNNETSREGGQYNRALTSQKRGSFNSNGNSKNWHRADFQSGQQFPGLPRAKNESRDVGSDAAKMDSGGIWDGGRNNESSINSWSETDRSCSFDNAPPAINDNDSWNSPNVSQDRAAEETQQMNATPEQENWNDEHVAAMTEQFKNVSYGNKSRFHSDSSRDSGGGYRSKDRLFSSFDDSSKSFTDNSWRNSRSSRPSWGERGSSSERDADYKSFCEEAKKDKEREFHVVVEQQRDLFEMSKEFSLAHCVAEDMGMGSGIAVQFRRDFKRVDELLNQRQKQGGLAVLEDGNRYIYYLVTKRISSGKPTYRTLFKSLKKLKEHVESNKVNKVAMPRIGCGLDRLEWSYVKLMLEYIFSSVDVEIVICNFQQGDESPAKYKNCRVVNVEYPIQNIESGTIIIYMISEDNNDISEEMQELDNKFNFLNILRSSPRRLGSTIVHDKQKDYRLYGCVVKKSKKDPFDFVAFKKCIQSIDKENRKLEFQYVAFQSFRDENDEVINEKVQNIMRNSMRNVEVYVCKKSD